MSLENLYISDELTIPAHELMIRACRASGPGGQHVNKSNTKIQLSWSPASSAALNEEQRELILQKLRHRVNREGFMTCSVDEHRSQHRNIDEARERLSELVRHALIKPKARKPTKRSRASKERRLRSKRQRSELKAQRRDRDWS
jgi:ribosome-associated protein